MQIRKTLYSSKAIILPFLALAMAGHAVPAQAAEDNFTGITIGAQAGWEERSIDETVLPDTLDVTLSDKSDGFAYGGFVAFDQQFDSFVLGAEAGFSPNGRTLTAELDGGAIELDSKWSADFTVRAGVVLGERVLAYGRVGYTLNRYTISGFVDGDADAVERDGETADGILFGGGLELATDSNLVMRVEYRQKEMDGSLSSKQVLGGMALRF